MRGAIHKHSIAVMIPSRPKTVLNHGTPAYGYGPSGLPSISIRRSAAERVSHAFEAFAGRRDSALIDASRNGQNRVAVPEKLCGRESNDSSRQRDSVPVLNMDFSSFGSNVIWK